MSALNEYGVPVSSHVCETCGVEFTITPAVDSWPNCMADDCASYDPSCDIEILFMSDREIAREKKVVDIGLLRRRKMVT